MDSFVVKYQHKPEVEVPANLDDLDKAKLIALVKSLVAEREEKNKKRSATSALADGSAKKAAKVEALTEKDRAKLLASISKKAVSAIKKTAHNDKRKPFSEVCEGMSRETAIAMLGAVGVISSDTKKMQKRLLSHDDIVTLFGIRDVHPVK